MTFAATIITLHTEMFLGPLGVSLAGMASLDTDGHYSRPDVFELSVDTRAKDGVTWLPRHKH